MAASCVIIPNARLLSKGKAVPLQAWAGPWASRRLRLPEFLDDQHMKFEMLLAPRTGRLYPQETSCYSFLLQAESRIK